MSAERTRALMLAVVADYDDESLGRFVREIWIEWAQEQPNPKPSWLVPWEGLSEPDKEADRRIGRALFRMGRTAARSERDEANGPKHASNRDVRPEEDDPARPGETLDAGRPRSPCGAQRRSHAEPFRVVVADPPWQFGDALGKRGAAANYPTMTLGEIRRFLHDPLIAPYKIGPDALLFLWRVSSMVPEAYAVADAWGFTAKSEIVWRKLTRGGKAHFGLGRYVRATHETAILAARGRPDLLAHNVRSLFEAQVGRHSEKPEAFYDLVEELSPGPYLELFARRSRPGWTCLGNEV